MAIQYGVSIQTYQKRSAVVNALWISERLEDKRTVLKLAFAERLGLYAKRGA